LSRRRLEANSQRSLARGLVKAEAKTPNELDDPDSSVHLKDQVEDHFTFDLL